MPTRFVGALPLLLVAACATTPAPAGSGNADTAPATETPATLGDAGALSPDAGALSPDAGALSLDAGALSPDAGPRPVVPGAQRRTTTIDGQARSYLLVVPEGACAAGPLPLVFAWHGLGGSGALFRLYSGLEAAIKTQAIIVYPDALRLPAFNNRTGWNLAPDGPDLRFFDAMLAEVSGELCVDRARVFSTGHSFGGYMSHTLGCTRAAVVKAIAPVAGGLPPAGCEGNKALPVWMAHAMNDPTVPFATGDAARAHWAAAAACAATTHPVTPDPCVAFDGCTAPLHWCVHTGGHAWPSFAAAAIWEFFRAL
jgi:poly(3-hydroxybutyrate) depolymerase